MSTELVTASIPGRRRRWLARGALASAAAALAVLAFAPGVRGGALLALVVGHYAVILAGVWLFLAHRGVVRGSGAALVVAAVVSLPVVELVNGLLWVVATCSVLVVAAYVMARAALRPETASHHRPSGSGAPPPRHPVVIMNPRSGGGKVDRFGLREKAEQLGATVVLVDEPHCDVGELARKAVADGADLLGVASGDGTVAVVAGVAAEHGIPLLVVPAGTRNHFALDLGLDRDDPSRSLAALVDGVDVDVDLGDVDGAPFVNNVSFGAYAGVVARPDYRADKLKVTLDVLPDMLSGDHSSRLEVHAGDTVFHDPQAALVSNNPYATADVVGLGRRARLDSGVLGVATISVTSALQAAGLVLGWRSRSATLLTTTDVTVDASTSKIPAGVDGESLLLTTPVHCRIRPNALRVRVPRQRPGVPPMPEERSLAALVRMAGLRPRRAVDRS